MELQRREFNKMILSAVGGIMAGAALTGCESGEKTGSGDAAKISSTDVHICKGKNACKGKGSCKSGDNGCGGKNSCKGKGGCASDSAKHKCKGLNECKGLGGCKTGDAGCGGKNSCKGKGGCSIPMKKG